MSSLLPDLTLLRLVMLMLAGRQYWVLPLLPLLWLIVLGVILWINGESIAPEEAQGFLLAVPMTGLAVFMGMRIIGGEIDDRSLEIAYTVPGGCERLWYAKLVAAGAVLLISEVLLAVSAYTFFTPFPLGALYGALQASCFYLILALAMATLFRSEAAGAMATAAILGLNALITGFGDNQVRISPFWNPHALTEADPTELFAWTLQNRIGMLLAMVAILSLAFMRANRREQMLSG